MPKMIYLILKSVFCFFFSHQSISQRAVQTSLEKHLDLMDPITSLGGGGGGGGPYLNCFLVMLFLVSHKDITNTND